MGSTALKQSRLGALADARSKSHASWFSTIQGFYIESRQAVLHEWKSMKALDGALDEYFGAPPAPWKTVGDEVLYVKLITDFRQVAVTLKCWIAAATRMREAVKRDDSRLDVKCTAWLAGFPFKNREVVLGGEGDFPVGHVDDYFYESGKLLNKYYKDGGGSGINIDYIGPSIDTGFRLSGYSSKRKFVVSVDVAYMLALAMRSAEGIVDYIPVFYDGSVFLKGVFGGAQYPIFWIDMGVGGDLANLEDALTNQRPPARDDVIAYCERFYEEYSEYTYRPFIDGDTGRQLLRMPPWYEDAHINLIKNFSAPQGAMTAELDLQSSPNDQELALDSELFKTTLDEIRQDISKIAEKTNDALRED